MTYSLDYSSWEELNRRFLISLSGKKVVVTFSGGKDSSATLALLRQASKVHDIEFEVHGAEFPHHVITAQEKERLGAFWEGLGIQIQWHEVSVPDSDMDEALSKGESACSICNRAKKSTLMTYFKKQNYDLDQVVVVMGYSLWDIVSAMTEHMLSFRFRKAPEKPTDQQDLGRTRFLETSQRFYPWLRLKGGQTVYKPLIWYNDYDILEFVKKSGIPITQSSCRFKNYRPKRILAIYYERMGLTFDFDEVFGFSRKAFQVPEVSYFEQLNQEDYLKYFL